MPKKNQPAVCGDVNADGVIDIGDVVYLINFTLKGGLAPYPVWIGDVDSDLMIDLDDVAFLINYLFRDEDPPGC